MIGLMMKRVHVDSEKELECSCRNMKTDRKTVSVSHCSGTKRLMKTEEGIEPQNGEQLVAFSSVEI